MLFAVQRFHASGNSNSSRAVDTCRPTVLVESCKVVTGVFGEIWNDPMDKDKVVKTFRSPFGDVVPTEIDETFLREMAVSRIMRRNLNTFFLPLTFGYYRIPALSEKESIRGEMDETDDEKDEKDGGPQEDKEQGKLLTMDLRGRKQGSLEEDVKDCGTMDEDQNTEGNEDVDDSVLALGFKMTKCSGDTYRLFIVDHPNPRIASLQDVARILFCCLISLFRAHSLGLCHRDVKTDNILVQLDVQTDRVVEAVLSDWGKAKSRKALSHPDGSSSCSGNIMASIFRPPEILCREQYLDKGLLDSKGYSDALDFWGLGMSVVSILFRRHPETTTCSECFEKGMDSSCQPNCQWKLIDRYLECIKDERTTIAFGRHVPETLLRVLRVLLCPSPSERRKKSRYLLSSYKFFDQYLPQVCKDSLPTNTIPFCLSQIKKNSEPVFPSPFIELTVLGSEFANVGKYATVQLNIAMSDFPHIADHIVQGGITIADGVLQKLRPDHFQKFLRENLTIRSEQGAFTSSQMLFFFTCLSLSEKLLYGKESDAVTPWFRDALITAIPCVPVEELRLYPASLELELAVAVDWDLFKCIEDQNRSSEPKIKDLINSNSISG